jgi:Protein of unknown function (DUF3987)
MLRDIAAKPQMRGRGVLGRFLFSIPPDLVGNRKITPDVIPDDVIHSYNETLKSLIIDLSEWTDRAIIPLSPAALKVHTEWRAEIEPRLKLGSGDLEPLRDWASKLPGATARLAGLLHLAENPKNGVRMSIHEDTMRRAVDLARYFAEHTMVAFGVMGAHPALDDAGRSWSGSVSAPGSSSARFSGRCTAGSRPSMASPRRLPSWRTTAIS